MPIQKLLSKVSRNVLDLTKRLTGSRSGSPTLDRRTCLIITDPNPGGAKMADTVHIFYFLSQKG
jgi:hypothetical protein